MDLINQTYSKSFKKFSLDILYWNLGYFLQSYGPKSKTLTAVYPMVLFTVLKDFSENLSVQLSSIPKRVKLQGVTDTRSINFNKGWSVSLFGGRSGVRFTICEYKIANGV